MRLSHLASWSAGALAVLLLTTSKTARADEAWGLPETPSPAPRAAVPAAPSAAPSAPQDERCAVDVHPNVSDADAAAVEDVVCTLIRTENVPGRHRIHVTKLGSKVVLTLVTTFEGVSIEKHLALSDMGEITVAAPRLLEASSERKAVADTVDVNNVVGDEARIPKKKHSAVHGWLGVMGGSASGYGSGGGMSVGLSAGNDRWSFITDFRLAGSAFNKPASLAALICTLGTVDMKTKNDFSFVSVSAGARHHFTTSDVSPFVGMGLALDYMQLQDASAAASNYAYSSYSYTGRSSTDYGSNTGLAAYAEAGLDLLRTHTIGGAVVIRADAPTYSVDTVEVVSSDPTKRQHTSTYAPFITAGIALRF